MPEEELKRGGTEAIVPRPIENLGQCITIHSVPDGDWIWPETPSLAKEFLK